MSVVVVFDELATPQRATRVIQSADTNLYLARTDVVINPDLSLLEGIVPFSDWKHEAGAIVEWTQGEKDARTAARAAAAAADAAQEILDNRTNAQAILAEAGELGVLVRSLADLVREQLNVLRAFHSLPDLTLTQLRNAMNNKMNSGDVDS